jgi:AAA domain
VDTDLQALQKTTRLMEYFSEITAAVERDPLRDILSDEAGAPDLIIWLDRLPDGVKLVLNSHDDVVLRIRPERLIPEPLPPEILFGWIDSEQPRGVEGPEPSLRAGRGEADSPASPAAPQAEVLQTFTRWHSQWTSWRRDQQRIQARRALYENLEQAAKTQEQHDDEYELVLGLGLLRWQSPDGEAIRRHLLTEVVAPRLDRVTAEVSVSQASGRRRLEDREILGDQDGYRADRGHALRREVCDADASPLRLELMPQLHALLADCLEVPVHPADPRASVTGSLPATPTLSPSPALIIRRRSRALLAETFRKIVEALREPGAPVPVGLAQLVVDTEPEQRNRWLRAQGALSGDVLGADPLFPLQANSEQMHVMDLLRTETCVVVQGPPGTGKTHTIANLVSALLARGQRVLVTSQKDQALRVLRDRIPPDLRDLCVLLTGGSKDAATELKRGLDALSAAVASPTTAALAERIDGLTEQRHVLRSRAAQLNHEVAQLRGIEQLSHEPLAPEYSRDRYRGTLGVELTRFDGQGR